MLQVSKDKWTVVGILSSTILDYNMIISVAGHLPWIRNVLENDAQ